MTDTTPLGLIVVRLKVPVKNMPVGTELGYKDVPDAIAALGSAAFFDVVRDQQGNPIPPLTPEEIEEAQRAAQRRAKSRRLILGADFDPLWNRVDGIPSAEELEQMRADVDAVADVPPRVDAVEQTTERLDTLTYDVERFVPASATRADAWQTAIDTAHANGGGTVTSSKRGDHIMTKGLTLKDGVYIALPGSGSVHLDFSTAPTSAIPGRGVISGLGSITQLPSLSVAASKDSRTLTFASAPGVAPGDILLIYNPLAGSFFAGDSNSRDGEFARVLSAASTTVTISAPLYANHPTSVSVYKVNPIRSGISGVRVTGREGKRVICMEYGTDLHFDDLVLTGSNYAQLEISRCFNVRASNVTAIDYTAGTANLHYGIMIGNSQTVYLDNVHLETSRHGLTTGGDAEVGSIPCRDIRVSNSYINGRSESSGNVGCLLHGNTEWAHFENCTFPNGFSPGGDHIMATDCTMSNGAQDKAIFVGKLIGGDIAITNCTIRATRGYTQYGLVGFLFEGTGYQRGGTLRFNRNTVDMGPYRSGGASSTTLYILNPHTADFPLTGQVEVVGNTFTSSGSDKGEELWAVIVSGTGGRGFEQITVTDNRTDMGIKINGAAFQYLDLSGNTIRNARGSGIRVVPDATGAFERPIVKMADTTVIGSHRLGVWLTGHTTLDMTVILDNVVTLNNNQSGGTAGTDASLYLFRIGTAYIKNCVIGDNQPVPTVRRRDAYNTVTTLVDQDNEAVGTGTSLLRTISAVTTHHYRGRGTGEPTLACADGSTYLRTDGGAGATLYVREGGEWVAK